MNFWVGRRPHTPHPSARVAFLASLASIVLACSSSGPPDEAQIHGIPVVRAAIHGPGTELPDGFEVAPGSWLLGAVFPEETFFAGPDGTRVDVRGWRGVLLATGDVQTVVAAYREQACDLDFEPGQSCYGDQDAVLMCDATAYADRAQFSAKLTRRGTGLTSSHLVLSYREAVQGAFPPLPDIDLPESDAPPVPLPGNWTPLARVGEDFGTGPSSSDEGLRLVAGSELIAPIGENPSCSAAGWIAVLRLSGPPRRVMREYAEQLGPKGFDSEVKELSADGPTTLQTGSDKSGSGLFFLEAVVREGTPTYLRVERCID